MIGNIFSILYFFVFQAAGVAAAFNILHDRDIEVKLLAGSVSGSCLLQWLPALFAFIFDFTFLSHILALITAAVITILGILCFVRRNYSFSLKPKLSCSTVIVTLSFAVFFLLVLSGIEFRDGAIYSSQATYGDMSMHLGFVTSIAEQGTFPPEYSILPGTRLSYPFLSDSISSSLYLVGAGLKLAYCLPMFFAGIQVFSGAFLFLKSMLKRSSTAILAFLMFFYCGGFGFAYFAENTANSGENFTRIFTAFYETPTNYLDGNVRVSNMIVDMLLPQRATLFGYAVLFCILLLLHQCVFGDYRNSRRGFLYISVLAGSLPMIHTHSFLALAVISACFLLTWLIKELGYGWCSAAVKVLFSAEMILLSLWSYYIFRNNKREDIVNMYVLAAGLSVFVIILAFFLVKYILHNGVRTLASTWGVYLVVTAALALPQLFIWTFGQATGDNFLRPYFNWANNGDNYLWFYLKNLGLTGIFGALGFLSCRKKTVAAALPVCLILFIAELVCFQPNTYDNNKLLYAAYLFVCAVAAEFLVMIYDRVRDIPHIKLASGLVVFTIVISGVLTICREFNAEYQLVGANYFDAAQYISDNTEPRDTILTDNRHNNEVAMLTGRNIVCGTGTFLYYHGLDYHTQEQALGEMYENPRENSDLFDKYSVDYIYLSDYERSSYNVDEDAISELFTLIYENPQVKIYKR